MATLTIEQKQFIIVRAAMSERGIDIRKAFKEEYGIDLSRDQVIRYFPGTPSANKISKPLVELFNTTRQQFLDETVKTPVANRAYRLRKLNDMFHSALDRGNLVLAANLLEQAAKESGDAFTNKVKHEGKVKHEVEDVSFAAGEKRALLADAMTKALDQREKPTVQ